MVRSFRLRRSRSMGLPAPGPLVRRISSEEGPPALVTPTSGFAALKESSAPPRAAEEETPPTRSSTRLQAIKATKASGATPSPPATQSLDALKKAALEARARLRRRLADLGLDEFPITGDGACQFRALAHQLRGDQRDHAAIRAAVVGRLSRARDTYAPFVVDETYDAFLRRMRKPDEWGDHVTLQAAADEFGIRICLLTSYATNPFLHILPSSSYDEAAGKHAVQERPPNDDDAEVDFDDDGDVDVDDLRTVWLLFWAEVHYSSIRSYTDDDGNVVHLVDETAQDDDTTAAAAASGTSSSASRSRHGRSLSPPKLFDEEKIRA